MPAMCVPNVITGSTEMPAGIGACTRKHTPTQGKEQDEQNSEEKVGKTETETPRSS